MAKPIKRCYARLRHYCFVRCEYHSGYDGPHSYHNLNLAPTYQADEHPGEWSSPANITQRVIVNTLAGNKPGHGGA